MCLYCEQKKTTSSTLIGNIQIENLEIRNIQIRIFKIRNVWIGNDWMRNVGFEWQLSATIKKPASES